MVANTNQVERYAVFHFMFLVYVSIAALVLKVTWVFLFWLLPFNQSHQSEPQAKGVKMSAPPPPKEEDDSGEEEEEEDDEQGATCGACGDNYGTDEFWICCDMCEKWFHGKCVKITPAKAEHIKQYKCPSCSNKRPRV